MSSIFSFSDDFGPDFDIENPALPPVVEMFFPAGMAFGDGGGGFGMRRTMAKKKPREYLTPAWLSILNHVTTERQAIAAIDRVMYFGDEATQITMIKEIVKEFPRIETWSAYTAWEAEEDAIHTVRPITDILAIKTLDDASRLEAALAILEKADANVFVVMDGAVIPPGKRGILYIVDADEIESALGDVSG